MEGEGLLRPGAGEAGGGDPMVPSATWPPCPCPPLSAAG